MVDPLLDEIVEADGDRYRVAWFDPPCQRVEEGNGDSYYQTRFWARVELDAFTPEHEMTARRLVSPEDFRAALSWGAETTAGLILERGLAIEEIVAIASAR